MTLAIIGIGTAVPADSVSQQEGERIAQWVAGRDFEQAKWLPHIYAHSGIDKRHMCLGRGILRDIFEDTRTSQSVFLPRSHDDDRGPTTGQRLEVYGAQSPALAVAASRQALRQSRLDAEAITHLITVSCTGFQAPGVDVEIIKKLGLLPTTQRTHIGYMGCHGALNGLRVARAFVDADP